MGMRLKSVTMRTAIVHPKAPPNSVYTSPCRMNGPVIQLEPGPHGHLDADLPRLLPDDGVHDIGHADASDQERQRPDDPQEKLHSDERVVHCLT